MEVNLTVSSVSVLQCRLNFSFHDDAANLFLHRLHVTEESDKDEIRMLGLAMVPGHHIVSIHIDENCKADSDYL